MCPGNVGQQSVDIFAPGTSIWGTVRDGAFHNSQKMGGTSAAAAIVAGVAALVENVDPDADPALVKDTLMRSVGDTRTPGLIPVSVSGGRVNAARAVDARGTPPLSPNGPGGPWVTCDPDHDGVVLNLDICPDLYGRGTLDGCPDADADGVDDSRDNCTSTPNFAQADDDGDRLGNACDPTPRGEDPDGDRTPNLDDACPTVYGYAGQRLPRADHAAAHGHAEPHADAPAWPWDQRRGGQGRRQGDAQEVPARP